MKMKDSDIEKLLSQCMRVDRFRLRKQYQKISQIKDPSLKQEKWVILHEKLTHSIRQCENRKLNLPHLIYPELPIIHEKQTIIQALKCSPVVIVAGETGSGKTTQLPKICLEAGLGVTGYIGHTQPRRIAARSVAARIASELNSPMGDVVGYKVRFSDRTTRQCFIKIMTDGILLLETQKDKWLQSYDCLIIDEAHERSLNIDFILGYLKILLAKRNDLKLIVTSATIDVERFSQFFAGAPIIEVKGRNYPVEINYLSDALTEEDDPALQVLQAVQLACKQGPGDILIFQSGEKEIHEVMEVLAQHMTNVVVLPLYARLTVTDQQKVFKPYSQRKIIVATNVAETSITVPNIRFVIDTGYVRISRYQYRNKLQRLPIEPISQASAEQRKGRCGRVGPGICYRLYTQEDFQSRSLFTEPEILRTNLAGVILKMLALGLKNIGSFPFIDLPDTRYIKDGLGLLERLGAVDLDAITPMGRLLANIPIEPKLGRMIIAANQKGALKEILIIVSALSISDPRERPIDFQAKADLAHEKFYHENSDFISFLKLWNFIYERKQRLSHQQFRKLCRENFLSYLRVCEWFDIHEQLRTVAKELGFRINVVPADESIIHQSLLAGLIDTIGLKTETKEYLGARNIKFFLHPQSVLFKKSPLWMMACEIVHTTKVYARTNAKIEPLWIEESAGKLLKKQYFEPYFEPSEGRVVAWMKATLFGLEVIRKRRVSYENLFPEEARQIFIQQGLVQGEINTKCPFYGKNKNTIQKLEDLELRVRRQLILIDENLIYQFYDKNLDSSVYSTKTLEKWLSDKDDSFLVFSIHDICTQTITQQLLNDFPNHLIINDIKLPLHYQFDMTAEDDGITLQIPLSLLLPLKDFDYSWLVPGLVEEKLTVMMKALPKRVRAQLLPLPVHIQKAKEQMSSQVSFTQALVKYLQEYVEINLEILDNISLPAHLIMHFNVVDAMGNSLAMGNNLPQLYETLKEKYSELAISDHSLERNAISDWDFGDLPLEHKIKKNQHEVIYYAALVEDHGLVHIQLFDTANKARSAHRLGLTRMYLNYLHDSIKYFKRKLTNEQKKQLNKLYLSFGDYDELLDEILFASAYQVFVASNENVRSQSHFEQQLMAKRGQFLSMVDQTLILVKHILMQCHSLQHRLYLLQAKLPHDISLKDIQQQLAALFLPHFIKSTPLKWLQRYPTYLKAIDQRMEKLPRESQKDKQSLNEIDAIQKLYARKIAKTNKPIEDLPEELLAFRWKIEELRVSYYAQTLGTIEPISKIRLIRQLEQLTHGAVK